MIAIAPECLQAVRFAPAFTLLLKRRPSASRSRVNQSPKTGLFPSLRPRMTRKNSVAGNRRTSTAGRKATATLRAIRGELTVADPLAKRGVHRTLLNTRKRQAPEGMSGFFSGRAGPGRGQPGRRARSRSCTPGSAGGMAGFF
ncbi:hypothetical protein IQ782_26895 [Salipiger pacificus]|uniref:Uncharacterized protein n=1 Tax=Salipiger mangrovisoli TaxID=2865933 RepID=A0ABR9XA49_9RHOB|nr:hypothetical protein [Salipiger mangrovisoli]